MNGPAGTRRDFLRRAGLGLLAAGTAASAAPAPGGRAVDGSRRGIVRLRRHARALESPPQVPAGEQWRYGLSYPFQITATTAGLYCGTKPWPAPGQDFGGGTDIVPFSEMGAIDAGRAVTVARNFVAPNPNNGGRPAIMIRNPGMIGFVPAGARRADGSPHPHAGTGFALVTIVAWPTGPGETPLHTAPDRIGYAAYPDARRYRAFELCQLHLDGDGIRVGARERIEMPDLAEGFRASSAGMGCALADGDDLLCGFTAYRGQGTATGAGVLRWRRPAGEWRPAAYELATPEDNSMEPSLVRDRDGSLLLCARAPRAMGPPVRIWRQAAPGEPWEKRIHRDGLIPSVPVTLNRAVDGTPYLAANLYEPQYFLPAGLHADGGVSRLEPAGRRGERSTLCLWALSEARDGFDAQFVLRDPLVEFGPPPHGTIWAADHATGGVVRLADGNWRALVGWRLLEWKENTHMIPPGPRSGSYLDEVVSVGAPEPLWAFGSGAS